MYIILTSINFVNECQLAGVKENLKIVEKLIVEPSNFQSEINMFLKARRANFSSITDPESQTNIDTKLRMSIFFPH